MTCNCKEEIEAELTKKLEAAKPDARDHRARLQGYGLAIKNGTMKLLPTMSYEEFAYVPLKTGGEKPQKKKGTMVFSFCPFCGVSLDA